MTERFNKKQREAFVRIQNEVLSKMDITNKEVAEMFTLEDKEKTFTLFRFLTPQWITQDKIKPYYDDENV